MSKTFWRGSGKSPRVPRAAVLGVAGLLVVTGTLAVAGHLRAAAPPGRYTADGGTVVDKRTQLEWQQGTAPVLAGTGKDLYTWQEATTYCTGLALKGGGWRLPSVKELHSLVDRADRFPAIDRAAFPNAIDPLVPDGPASYTWTNTKVHASATGERWKIYFGDGRPRPAALADGARVRCVRIP